MKTLVERHGLELAVPQARNCNDVLLEGNLHHSAPKIVLQALGLRFAGNRTLPEYSRRNANVLEQSIK